MPELSESLNVCSAGITSTVFSAPLDELVFGDVEGKIHIVKQSF
jgi:hypothetical protein